MYLQELKQLGKDIWRVDVRRFSYYIKIKESAFSKSKWGYCFGKLDYEKRKLYLSEENNITNKLINNLKKAIEGLEIKKENIIL